jgi:hypothetical protein
LKRVRLPTDPVAQPPSFGDEGAATVFGPHHALLRQHREGPADRMPVHPEAFGQRQLAVELVALVELAANDVEADRIGDLPPQRHATSRGLRSAAQHCHCKFIQLA